MASVQLLASVLTTEPLQVHVSLANPEGAPGSVAVPRGLGPLGAYIRLELRSTSGAVLCRTHRPKFSPKLRPGEDSAYVALEPGTSWGAVFTWEDCSQVPSAGQLSVAYANEDYQGTAALPVGALSLETLLSF